MKVTARGAITLLFFVCLLGQFTLPGPFFLVGALAAVWLVNPRDLLTLVVSPPLVFFVSALLVEGLGSGGSLQSFGLGMFTTLSAAAPWLFAGSALALGLAWYRGLPQSVRATREDMKTRVPEPRKSKEFDAEPEGYFEPRVYGTAKEERPQA
ncbi:hypothetical protein GT755_34335 [Herbidospora sp. NEAU-GS84]|uniref:DUF6542 domain-containing protein n=1 Tax=Herbidospora solisilvae TaxID=2696284 RepID=A0A7C9K198_9ACTN|nr:MULTISPECIES: DUF6542 domain-containing protein [Herbidospora]NAS26739.1 hypothetical protein [Herbidospora solisilvae]GLX98906.1 hypothetical protein Hesp01_68560 [Herbidospora sp. NBRC 101105]